MHTSGCDPNSVLLSEAMRTVVQLSAPCFKLGVKPSPLSPQSAGLATPRLGQTAQAAKEETYSATDMVTAVIGVTVSSRGGLMAMDPQAR